jgi:hypothetical protein
MDLPKCRTCGERHRLGPCPSSQTKSRGDEFTDLTARQAKVRADAPRADAGVAPSPRDANPVAKATKGNTAKSDDVPKSDGVVSRRATPRSVATTSENLDVTAGETAPKFDRATYHRGYMRDYMRKRRQAEKKEPKG